MLATGARHAYFGHDEWEPFAPGLKTLEDATTIRRRILLAFEQAEQETDPEKRQALMTLVIIGGGPTGVELAGTIAELTRDTLAGEFRNIDTSTARVVLIEAGERVLPGFKPELSAYAKKALERLGVTVELGRAVSECNADGVVFGGERLPAGTIIWAAGVAASPAAEWLGVAADRVGRIMVEPDLTVPGHPDIFAIGDTAHVEWKEGRLVPGVAPAAKQQGKHVAATVRARLAGDTAPRPFQLPARRRSGDDRQARRGDRFRLDQAHRPDRLVDVGRCPHLFPDRAEEPADGFAELAMDLRDRAAQRPADHAGRRRQEVTGRMAVAACGFSPGGTVCHCPEATMDRLAWCFAILLGLTMAAASQTHASIEALLDAQRKEFSRDCKIVELTDSFLMRTDVNGDGLDDAVLDYGGLNCDGSSMMYCGSCRVLDGDPSAGGWRKIRHGWGGVRPWLGIRPSRPGQPLVPGLYARE